MQLRWFTSVLISLWLAPRALAETKWAGGHKQGVGTSNTTASKVWFTLGDGALNEVYYPTVDKPNTRSLELIITDGQSFADLESRDTIHRVEIPFPYALFFRQINTSKKGSYRVIKSYATDPERNALLIDVRFTPARPGKFKLYVLYDPSINNSALYDTGYEQGGALIATESNITSALLSSPGFTRTSSGRAGIDDGWTDIKSDFRMDYASARSEGGDLVQIGQLPEARSEFRATLALGFGEDARSALEAARASLRRGFDQVLEQYVSGWRHYLAQLKKVQANYRNMYLMSAMVLKAHEDKTYRGAIVASLSIPWGNWVDASEPNFGGYHLVWPRDLYHAATALLAMGDRAAAQRALSYMFKFQQRPDGSFVQNSWLDGKRYWDSLQMDEVAYPIILAYQLGRSDRKTYLEHIKPAADFIANNGPATPQERWEEESGYSPATIAAEIAGLVCAAEIAEQNRDHAAARRWLETADLWEKNLESWTVTTNGPHGDRYFVRISQEGRPNDGKKIEINNGGGIHDEREIVDMSFLELVRLGIRSPDDPTIKKSLEVVDRLLKVNTPSGPCWYRYNHDGYGEKADGSGHDGKAGIGRLWVLLVGERGQYELLAGRDARPYLETMQRMANAGLMLSEQIWDRAETPDPEQFQFGRGTSSATPLVWSHAQFIRLAIAIKEGKPSDMPAAVAKRYLRPKR
jgi:glucoamylase